MRFGFSILCIALGACTSSGSREDLPASDSVPMTVPAVVAPVIDSTAPKLFPVDQADSSFRAFRTRALQALARRDTVFLYSILAPEIKNSFGGDDSISGFRRTWNMANASQSKVWSALTRVLTMGGKQEQATFIAPYVFAFWPDTIDAFAYVAVTSDQAMVHADSTSTSPVIGTTSYAIVKLQDPLLDAWAHVVFPNGRKGWLSEADVYSPVGWRAFFVRKNGAWTLTTLVAGD